MGLPRFYVATLLATTLVSFVAHRRLWSAQQTHISLRASRRETEHCRPDSAHKYFILACIANMEKTWQVSAFIRSAQRHSPRSRLVLFVQDASAPALPGVHHENVEFVSLIPSRWRVGSQRFVSYVDYISSAMATGKMRATDGVILTDARDVVLQADPWAHPRTAQALNDGTMIFAYEGTPQRPVDFSLSSVDAVHSTGANRIWIEQCFGKAVLDKIAACKECVVACSGIMLGRAQSVLATAQSMVSALQMGKQPETCHDQPALNYLLWSGETINFTRTPVSWDSPIMTLLFASPFTVDGNGFVDTIPSSKPTMLHQYDRWRNLSAMVHGMYPWHENAYVI